MIDNGAVAGVAGKVEAAGYGERPWHGADNPFEALWLHFTAEIAGLRERVVGVSAVAQPVQGEASAAEVPPVEDAGGDHAA
jgi:hypothetical protein